RVRAVQIPMRGSSELTSINFCTLFDGCRVYVFGDGSTWPTHDFKGNGDNEDMSSGEYEEDGKDEEDYEEHMPEKEQEKGRGKGQGKTHAQLNTNLKKAEFNTKSKGQRKVKCHRKYHKKGQG
ncbi:MAG: hypothetical protein ACKPKO_13105, partial [Candidatus Fonsibacter sp.]